jgi:hypothetical protein
MLTINTKYELTNIQLTIYYNLKNLRFSSRINHIKTRQPQVALNLSRFSVTEKEILLKQIRK